MELFHQQPESSLAPMLNGKKSGSAIRTYSQVASILADRHGVRLGAAQVRQICISAETKLARAFLADPVLRRRLLSASDCPLREAATEANRDSNAHVPAAAVNCGPACAPPSFGSQT